MNDRFALVSPIAAFRYLAGLSSSCCHNGESIFRAGQVSDLISDHEGHFFTAKVQDAGNHEVTLVYKEDNWTGTCTCTSGGSCPHTYAAMKAALAQNSLNAVRRLSAPNTVPTPSAAPVKPEPTPELSLREQILASLKRSLTKEESRFLLKLEEVYRRCLSTRQITRWEFSELGLSLGGPTWGPLQIWPAFPKNQREFWLYIANALVENKQTFPEFLQPISQLEEVQKRLQSWRRAQEITRWEELLAQAEGRSLTPQLNRPHDLRLVLGSHTASLQVKSSPDAEFEDLKLTRARQLAEFYRLGTITFVEESAVIWEVFYPRVFLGHSLYLSYTDSEEKALLGRLVRLPSLNSRILTDEGLPLSRPEQPLRWELIPPSRQEDNYQFRLVHTDGTPLKYLLFSIPGEPTLYLTRTALFTGPKCPPEVLEPLGHNLIPAPALETPAGISLLNSLEVPLPPSLEPRVRRIPMKAIVTCGLQPSFPGSEKENCTFKITAESNDHTRKEIWTGSGWTDANPRKSSKKLPIPTQEITFYDRTTLREVPTLLAPLNAKPEGYHGTFAIRVTKKFPEIFLTWLKNIPPHIHVDLQGELATLAKAPLAGNVRLDITETTIDWFDLQVVLDVSDTTLTPEEIRLLLNAKGAYVRLGKKGWQRLAFNLSQDDDEQLARLGLNPHELTAEPQRMHALQLADPAARKFLPAEQVEQVQRRAHEIKARVTPDLPKGVTAQLRPYQTEGFHFLAYLSANHFGGILADDMGLGKTVQTLTWIQWLREGLLSASTPPRPSLVVCPKSVVDNWRAEAHRFVPTLRIKVWTPSELELLLQQSDDADVHVINYSQLRLLGEGLTTIPWLALILDEGQYIKNPNSQTTQIARALRADHRLILSGTPIENRLLDLWSLMSFAMPGVLGSRHHFLKMCDAKEDPLARRRLASRVRPFLLRRTKSQVARDLPDRIEEDLFCEIEGEQKALYRAEFKRAQQMLLKIKSQKELARDRFHLLTSLLRLRQICCHPALVKPDSRASSAKLDALLEQIEPLIEEGQKVLVFSQFVEMLTLIRFALADRGWPTFYLAGETENRGELVQEFQSTPGAAVFLISLKAGGFGLNLTAASYVVLFDPWWNPAVENQAIDRTHRIGQINKVIAYRLLIKDSIEEKIRALQKTKSAIAEDVLGEEKFSQSLTLDDLKFLFTD